MTAKQSLYEIYADLQRSYVAQFGPRTTVFLQVGSFYELYDTQNPTTGATALNIREITDSLGFQIAIHKGEAPAGHDGLVAGFPDYALHKWAGRLTSAGWTVVVVDQKKDARGKVASRTLARVLSPSTHVENASATEIPYLTIIYMNAMRAAQPPTFGTASLDLTTGLTITYADKTAGRPDFWTADTLVQKLSIFQPKEVLVYWHSTTQQPPQNLRTILGLPDATTFHVRTLESIGAFSRDVANAEYLRKAYSIRSLLPPREYLGIRTQTEEVALLYLLQFIEEHMPSVSQQLSQNEAWVPEKQLVCGNHALAQLQIPDVAALFTGALTPMGKRGITQRLLRPMTDPADIERNLCEIDEITVTWSTDLLSTLQAQLRFCYDIPRLHRKMRMGTLAIAEYAQLYQTYVATETILQTLSIELADSKLLPDFTLVEWRDFLAQYTSHIDPEKVFRAMDSQDISPFDATKYPDCAIIESRIQTILQDMTAVCQRLAQIATLPADALRLESREKGESYGIRASSAQIRALQQHSRSLPQGTHISALKSGGWVDTPELATLNQRLLSARAELAQTVQQIHLNVCQDLTTTCGTLCQATEQWLSHIDTSLAIAQTCRQRGFQRPTILKTAESSSVDITGLRHPLVESTGSRTSYVQHSVSLGKDPTSRGYLIYGMNASGKSTLMKATGVAVILAQAGCYVPATKMELAPFRAVYTRILNHDNLFAGLSSFAVEMSELRDILSAADHKTLVLGDELCAGTESVSAEALVASGIQWLSNQSAKFMFATHLHHLSTLLAPKMDTLGLKIFHLHVDYDPVTKKLVYDRSLRPGSGTSLYGLEVARAMDLPLEFIEMALENRRQITGSATQEQALPSTWNTSLVRKSCEMCQSQITTNLEVHHITPRALANRDGILPNGMHMNTASNLIVLCDTCHDKHHAGNLVITPLVQTSDGPERIPLAPSSLSLSSSSPPSSVTHTASTRSSKWSEEQLDQIRAFLRQYKTMTLKVIQFQLKQQYDIDISAQMLGKMRREN